jgi:hypothetical protein
MVGFCCGRGSWQTRELLGGNAVPNFFADAYGLSGSERGKRSISSCEGTLQRQRKMRDQLFCAKLLGDDIGTSGSCLVMALS